MLFKKQTQTTELEAWLEQKFGIKPKKKSLYQLAFTHTSANPVNFTESLDNYERLEFLGDSILNFLVSEYLFEYFPNEREGLLSQYRAQLVNRNTLNRLAQDWNCLPLIRHKVGDFNKAQDIAGSVLEALLGAFYLDLGLEKTRQILRQHWLKKNFELLVPYQSKDYKSLLHQLCQKQKKQIVWNIQEEKQGKVSYFWAEVFVDQQVLAKEQDTSKKKAMQQASKIAYQKLLRDLQTE